MIFKIFAVSCAFLLVVMLKIVIFDKEKFTYAASKQHLIPTTVKIYRGMIYDRNYIPFVDCRSYILNKDDGNGKSVRYNVTKRYDERSLARHLVGYVDAKNDGASGLEKRFNSYLSGEGSYVFSSIGDVNSNSIKALPETVKNVIKCKNPRCITTTEQEIEHIFKLTDRENKVYRCIYCESKAKR